MTEDVSKKEPVGGWKKGEKQKEECILHSSATHWKLIQQMSSLPNLLIYKNVFQAYNCNLITINFFLKKLNALKNVFLSTM